MKTRVDRLRKGYLNLSGLDGAKVEVGASSWLAPIHEYGCSITVTPKMRAFLHRKGVHLRQSTTHIVIPERAFLRGGFDQCSAVIVKQTAEGLGRVAGGELDGKTYLRGVGKKLEEGIRSYALELDTPPNSSWTVEEKGRNDPLVDTGSMIESIKFEVLE